MTDYSLSDARKIGMDTPVPFKLMLPAAVFSCQTVLRILPQKRVVCSGRYGEQQVIIKIFFSERHFRRELQGLNQLKQHNIPCPTLIDSIEDRANKNYLLLLNYLPNTGTLDDCWQRCNTDEQRKTLIGQAFSLLASMHRAGLWQQDAHWDNFLIGTDQQLYVIDCGEIGNSSPPLNCHAAENNLALFMAQLSPVYDALTLDCLDSYAAPINIPKLKNTLIKQRRDRLHRYAEKSLRNATEFSVEKKWLKYAVIKRQYHNTTLHELFDGDIDRMVDQGTALKRGNTSTVSAIDSSIGPLVIKRYNIKNFMHAISRCWRPSRASISWQNAHRLKLLGIPTPEPVALIEQRMGPLRRKAYFISKQIQGEPLDTYINHLQGAVIPNTILEQISAIFGNLWRAGLSHGDLKASNIIVADDILFLIDLDSMRQHQNNVSLTKAIAKDKKRFIENWQGTIQATFKALIQNNIPTQ